MLRTRKTRPVGGALTLVITLLVSLVVGALGTTARADDGTTPAAEPTGTPTSDAAPSDPARPSTSAPDQASQQGVVAKLLDVVAGDPTVTPSTYVIRKGLTETVDLRGYVDCGPGMPTATCSYALAAGVPGWQVTVSPEGLLTLAVPDKTVPGAYNVVYNVTNDTPPGHTAQGVVTVAVTPDDYAAPSGMAFSHPYRKHYREKIRHRVLRTINSVPTGATIRIASWSFNSKSYRQALRQARKRGVAVQIVIARNEKSKAEYRRLKRIFGTAVGPTGTWVRQCHRSCRGRSGTMHSKIFLFSQVYRTQYVTMTGSANLTDFAVTNQWNQMSTLSGAPYQPVYDEAFRVIGEMSSDVPVALPYVSTAWPALGVTSYYYPRGAVTPTNDFMLDALAPVRCTGATNTGRSGRTVIKIAMYAWYQTRGQWLAKRVRQLWGQGCQIQIIYGISSDPVKTILYSPSGRGRIPMRQILLTNSHFVPIYYIHDKWVAIKGHYGNDTAAALSLQGSFNFSDLGFRSDENFQRIDGLPIYNQFARDFRLLWTDRQARAPSPISKIPTITGRYAGDDLALGTGVYRYMEAD